MAHEGSIISYKKVYLCRNSFPVVSSFVHSAKATPTTANACHTWRLLYEACRKLDDDLVEHMRMENEELFAPFLE